MQTIAQLAKQIQPQHESINLMTQLMPINESKQENNIVQLSEQEFSIENLVSLWLSMQALYPMLWFAKMGAVDDGKGVLTVQAKIWQRGLRGVKFGQVRYAIDYLTDNPSDFLPTLGQFKKLCEKCLERDKPSTPSLEEVINLIIKAQFSQGSIAERYKHPLAWAIAQHPSFDSFQIKTASTKECSAMVKPIYAEFLRTKWPEFNEKEKEVRLAIGYKNKPSSKDVANKWHAEAHLILKKSAVEEKPELNAEELAQKAAEKAKKFEEVQRLLAEADQRYAKTNAALAASKNQLEITV